MNHTNFIDLERAFWEVYRDYQPEQYINPVNLAEEKERFFQNHRYNPCFRYKQIDKNLFHTIEVLKKLKSDFQKTHEILSAHYILLIDELMVALEHFSKDRDNPEFRRWLTSLYHEPDTALILQAKTILNNIKKADKKKLLYSANEVAEIFRVELGTRGLEGWKIIIEEMPARISINQYDSIVRIKASARFSKSEVARLIVHEIETHILRAENAKKQPFLLFRYGFPNYLMSEEGLAIYAEEQSNLLSPYDMQKYTLRVLASSYGIKYDFVYVYELLRAYLDRDDAFSMTVRIKRGMQDTSLPGAFTKDQVYLAGYLQMKTALGTDIRKLFFGKIGLKDIKTIEKMDSLNTDIMLPHWLSNQWTITR